MIFNHLRPIVPIGSFLPGGDASPAVRIGLVVGFVALLGGAVYLINRR